MNSSDSTSQKSDLQSGIPGNPSRWPTAAIIVGIILLGIMIWIYVIQESYDENIHKGVRTIIESRIALTNAMIYFENELLSNGSQSRVAVVSLLEQASGLLGEGVRELKSSNIMDTEQSSWIGLITEIQTLSDHIIELIKMTENPFDDGKDWTDIKDRYTLINSSAEVLYSRLSVEMDQILKKQHLKFKAVFIFSVLALMFVGVALIRYRKNQVRIESELTSYRLHLEDLVEQRSAALAESESRLRAFLNALPDVSFVLDSDGRYIEVLSQDSDLLYNPKNELKGRLVSEILPKPQAEMALTAVRSAIDSGEIRIIEYDLPLTKGRSWFEGRCVPVETDKLKSRMAIFIARDITYQKRSRLLENVRNKVTEILANAAENDAVLVRILENVCNILGWARGEIWMVDPVTNRMYCSAMRNVPGDEFSDFQQCTIEISFERGVGLPGRIWEAEKSQWMTDSARNPSFLRAAQIEKIGLHAAFGVPIILSRNVVGAMLFFHREVLTPETDLMEAISDLGSLVGMYLERRKAMEELVEARVAADSAHEKETLIKEIHHRVKNNLQIVSSLLNLQARRTPHPEAVSVLLDTSNRVRAMALLHELLYRSKNLSRINFGVYVRELCQQLMRSTGMLTNQIKLEFDIKPVELPLEKSVPCGLIISELVSNALKHGFPKGRSGTVSIEFREESDNGMLLRISDDGQGLPDAFNINEAKSLGLKLVSELTDQLSGRFIIEHGHDKGTSFLIRFPLFDKL